MIAVFDKLHDVRNELSVFLEGFLLTGLLSILLYGPDGPQRNIRHLHLRNHLYGLTLHKITKFTPSSLHHQLEIVLLLNGEGKTRQCDESIAGTTLKPWKASQQIALVITFTLVELMGGID